MIESRFANGEGEEVGSFPGWPQATPVLGRQRSCHPGRPQGALPVQLWCNQGVKYRNNRRNGQITVDSLERMDVDFPQIQD